VKDQSWLFKKLNLSLRMEIIINISLLMMAAILLIGFTISKINKDKIIQEKVENGERMIQDFQVIVDFIARDRKDFSLVHPLVKKEIQDFIHIYVKERSFYDLVIVDQRQKVIASKRAELVDQSYTNDFIIHSIQSGQFKSRIEKS
jgi:hypothetical protein